jgi:hypothetical protein
VGVTPQDPKGLTTRTYQIVCDIVVIDDQPIENGLVFGITTFAFSDVIHRVGKVRSNDGQPHIALKTGNRWIEIGQKNTRDV